MGHHHHNHMLSFHYGSKKELGGTAHVLPPKGCMAIRVGQKEEEQERFVVPVAYLNHPLFIGLLKEAEDEYGFEHKGAITIPCQVGHFRHLRGIIDRDCSHSRGTAGSREHNHHLPHFHLYASCLKA